MDIKLTLHAIGEYIDRLEVDHTNQVADIRRRLDAIKAMNWQVAETQRQLSDTEQKLAETEQKLAEATQEYRVCMENIELRSLLDAERRCNALLKEKLDGIHSITGFIYLVELSPEKIGKFSSEVDGSIMKVGLTISESLNRLNAYGATRTEHRIVQMPVYEIFQFERKIKERFNSRSEIRLVRGHEYFCGDRDVIVREFDSFVEEMNPQIEKMVVLPLRQRQTRMNRGPPMLPQNQTMPPWQPEFVPSPENAQHWEQYRGENYEMLKIAYLRTEIIAERLGVQPDLVDQSFYEKHVATRRKRNTTSLVPTHCKKKTDEELHLKIPTLPRGEKMPAWRDHFRPTDGNATHWSMYDGDDRETMQRTFDIVRRTARVLRVAPDQVDERFFEDYVTAPGNPVSEANCLRYTFGTTYEENLQCLEQRIAALKQEDGNLELYKWTIKKRFLLQLLAQRFFERVLSEEDYAKMKRLEDVTPSRKKSSEFVQEVLAELSEEEKKNLGQLLDQKGALENKRPMAFVNAILRRTVGLTVDPSKSNDTKSSTYDRLRLSMRQWRVLRDEYGSDYFAAA